MEVKLFNTLTRRKEVFQPLRPGQVGIYTCGPTVYAPAHVGNLRSYVFPDILKKLLRELHYDVTHVINITDVGHLTSDEDTGEDKLELAAREAQRSAWDIAAEYTARYLTDLERLNIAAPDHLPRATAHVGEQIDMVRTLEEKGFTYRLADGIYFDTSRFPDYGRLARLRAEGLRQGARVDMGGKRSKTDFALWKFSPQDVSRQMEWDSPWGKGFPGWHIECSAMSTKYLGAQFDIHTGGTDHIPVHHTNEIAQTEAATGKPFVRYWLHGEYLVVGEERRMGKSEGNPVTLEELLARGYEPLAFRYLALNSHYRKYLNFTWQALAAADHALMGLRRALREAGAEHGAPPPGNDGPRTQALLAHLADDLNTPKALAHLWIAVRDQTVPGAEKLALASGADRILCLNLFDFSRLEHQEAVPPEVIALAEQRWQARQQRDFGESDRLRDLIAAQGYAVRDRKDGYDVVKS